MARKTRKPFLQSNWFKLILVLCMIAPLYTEIPYAPQDTSKVISAVLAKPMIAQVDWLRPVSKLVLMLAALLPIFSSKFAHRWLLGYYTMMLIATGVFQNIAVTEDYGFAWIIGNTLILVIAACFSAYDVAKDKTVILRENYQPERTWIVPLMALAFFSPYGIVNGHIYPKLDRTIFTNDVALAYCMITPVILGVLLLFQKGVYSQTLSILSFIGLIFSVMNLLTFVVLQPANWWMGVLHLPLMILSIFGMIAAKRESNRENPAAHLQTSQTNIE